MEFPWYTPYRNPDQTTGFKDKALEMYRHEVADRARLLHRLGYSREETVQRCTSYAGWDHDLTGASPITKEIKGIVDGVFGKKK